MEDQYVVGIVVHFMGLRDRFELSLASKAQAKLLRQRGLNFVHCHPRGESITHEGGEPDAVLVTTRRARKPFLRLDNEVIVKYVVIDVSESRFTLKTVIQGLARLNVKVERPRLVAMRNTDPQRKRVVKNFELSGLDVLPFHGFHGSIEFIRNLMNPTEELMPVRCRSLSISGDIVNPIVTVAIKHAFHILKFRKLFVEKGDDIEAHENGGSLSVIQYCGGAIIGRFFEVHVLPFVKSKECWALITDKGSDLVLVKGLRVKLLKPARDFGGHVHRVVHVVDSSPGTNLMIKKYAGVDKVSECNSRTCDMTYLRMVRGGV